MSNEPPNDLMLIAELNDAYRKFVEMTHRPLDSFEEASSAATKVGRMLLDLTERRVIFHFNGKEGGYKLGPKPIRMEWYD